MLEKTNAEIMAEWMANWAKVQEVYAEEKQQKNSESKNESYFILDKNNPSDDDIFWLAQNAEKFFAEQEGKKEDVVVEHQVDTKAADRIEKDNYYQNNPTYFASLGPDQKLQTTPDFTDGDVLRELNKKLLELYDKDDELGRARTLGSEKEVEKLKKERDALRKNIQELSQKLIPDTIKDPN